MLLSIVAPVSVCLAALAMGGCTVFDDLAGFLGSGSADPSNGFSSAIPVRLNKGSATIIGHLAQPAVLDLLEGDEDVDVYAVRTCSSGVKSSRK